MTAHRQIASNLGLPEGRALQAVFKARMIDAVLKESERRGLTHAELAERSGLPRSAVTGILSGSVQRVTVDRVLRLVAGAGLVADIRIRRAT